MAPRLLAGQLLAQSVPVAPWPPASSGPFTLQALALCPAEEEGGSGGGPLLSPSTALSWGPPAASPPHLLAVAEFQLVWNQGRACPPALLASPFPNAICHLTALRGLPLGALSQVQGLASPFWPPPGRSRLFSRPSHCD